MVYSTMDLNFWLLTDWIPPVEFDFYRIELQIFDFEKRNWKNKTWELKLFFDNWNFNLNIFIN